MEESWDNEDNSQIRDLSIAEKPIGAGRGRLFMNNSDSCPNNSSLQQKSRGDLTGSGTDIEWNPNPPAASDVEWNPSRNSTQTFGSNFQSNNDDGDNKGNDRPKWNNGGNRGDRRGTFNQSRGGQKGGYDRGSFSQPDDGNYFGKGYRNDRGNDSNGRNSGYTMDRNPNDKFRDVDEDQGRHFGNGGQFRNNRGSRGNYDDRNSNNRNNGQDGNGYRYGNADSKSFEDGGEPKEYSGNNWKSNYGNNDQGYNGRGSRGGNHRGGGRRDERDDEEHRDDNGEHKEHSAFDWKSASYDNNEQGHSGNYRGGNYRGGGERRGGHRHNGGDYPERNSGQDNGGNFNEGSSNRWQSSHENRNQGFNERGSRGGNYRGGGRRDDGGYHERNGDQDNGGYSNERGQQYHENSGRGSGRDFRGGGMRSEGYGGGRGARNDDRHDDDDDLRQENDQSEKPDPDTKPAYYAPVEKTDEELLKNPKINPGINFSKYAEIDVKFTGCGAPPPIQTFEEAKLRDILLNNLRNVMKYDVPTPVQKYAIPAILQRRDLMACAQTGSGKTAAFMLPILHHFLEDGDYESGDVVEPYALIIAPTRELARQIHDAARTFAYETVARVCVLYGGASTRYQTRLARGTKIVVATPGRVMDLIDTKNYISLRKLKYLVLDEGDRLLEDGFIPTIRQLFNHRTISPKEERTTLMFSATFPEEIQKLANDFLSKNYLFLSVGIVGGANTDVEQNFQLTSKGEKQQMLVDLVKGLTGTTLIFTATRRFTDFVASLLVGKDLPATTIHGGREQCQREEALRDFENRKFNILVATDVASRGLDIEGIDNVVNYDLPRNIEEYVHRIGRTARVGNTGKSFSLFDPAYDTNMARPLIQVLKDAKQTIPDWLQNFAAGGMESSSFNNYGGSDIRNHKESDNEGWAQPSVQEEATDEAWD